MLQLSIDGDWDWGAGLRKRLAPHSMHRSILLEHCSQMYVCPHGRTTGGRSKRLNASTQITQRNENGAVALVIGMH